MSQNALRLSWTHAEVDTRLHADHEGNPALCVRHGKREDGSVNYVQGANIAGFVKVANAMLAQGGVLNHPVYPAQPTTAAALE